MKLRTFANIAALTVAAWIIPSAIQAQPMYDRVNVNLPYPVTVGDKTLQPGDYIIQQLPSSTGDSRVVLIYSDNGMKFQTSAMSIPTLDPDTARDTKVVLGQLGNQYYLDKIWIQGKDYGYEFPMPDSIKSRQKEMSQSTMTAQYSATPVTDTTSTASAATTTADTSTGEAAAAVPPPVTSTPSTDSDAAAQSTPAPPPQNSADRSADKDDDTTSMPHTSAGWLLMLLSGGTLSGAGMALRRKR